MTTHIVGDHGVCTGDRMSALTKPMYQKYATVWAEHKERYGLRTALLYQVGGFFELYDTENLTTGTTEANIRDIAELCQLSLTSHAVEGAPHLQTLFGGFPEHALGKFERILVQAGYTVVVVVQRKDVKGSVEARVVDHIASPGCYVDSTTVAARERRLVGVVAESLSDGPAALRRVYWAAAAFDVATGRIWFVEGADRDRLHQFLCIHPPAELVLWSDGGAAAAHLTDVLRPLCGAVHLRCLAPAAVALDEAVLDRLWPVSRHRLVWIHRQPQARRCLAALMDFAGEHVPSALKELGVPEAWVPTTEVRLGNAALEQLGLLSLRDSDKQSLLGLLDECRSVAGRRLLRQRLLQPITDVGELERRLDLIDAVATTGLAVGAAVTEAVGPQTERALRSLYDLSRLYRRLELGTATMGDLACLLRSYEAAATLMELWPVGVPAGACEHLAGVLRVWNTEVVVTAAREGISVPVVTLPWFGATVSPSVAAAFETGLTIRREAEALCRTWSSKATGSKATDTGALYLDDAEGGGFRVTGTKRRISAAHANLRDSGDKSATITQYKASAALETAALNDVSHRHRTWYHSWLPIWADAWSAACKSLQVPTIHTAIEHWCAELDLSWTVARLAREWVWRRPVFVAAEDATIEVTGLRHPILERLQLGGAPYITHAVALGFHNGEDPSPGPGLSETNIVQTPRGLLLYGMNASGKSSLMKALGLCVVLAQCGLPVPAASCRLAPFTAIFTRILGNDNLWAGLSSFAVEMTEFREILQYADERSLVLGDELCSGTESLSATALVAAGVETLAARGTKFVFATHLHELAALPDIAGLATVRAVHLKVHYDATSDRLIYDRQLAPGAGSALYGLEVCRALDLPTTYLDRAMALRKALEGWQAPHVSAYSAAAVVDHCAICGSRDRLETHHIHPQAAAASSVTNVHAAGNLVCLCASCHDEHHAGRLIISHWEETSVGRRLVWRRAVTTSGEAVTTVGEAQTNNTEKTTELIAWIREQRHLKIRVPTIQKMARQIFGADLTKADIQAVTKT
jgi:DNA mismatch repair protein MutS